MWQPFQCSFLHYLTYETVAQLVRSISVSCFNSTLSCDYLRKDIYIKHFKILPEKLLAFPNEKIHTTANIKCCKMQNFISANLCDRIETRLYTTP